MTKYDDILNELVYKIDDVVYDFYSKSNELIATKANQDRLFTFRDKTINTINDIGFYQLDAFHWGIFIDNIINYSITIQCSINFFVSDI